MRITTKEYKEQIKDRNIIVLEEYINNNTKIKHQCQICDHIWSVIPNNIKRGIGCPSCAKKVLSKKLTFTTEQYKEQIKDCSVVVLEEYKGAKEKIKHQCQVCNHIWSVTPNNIKRGHGCPACSNEQRYKNKPTWLYYIKIPNKNIYKIGVSMDYKGGTKGRYKNEPFEIEIVQEELFEDGYKAYKLEQEIIQANKHLAWCPSKEEKFIGWTECFTENIIKI